jgi:hypothetical protein
MNDVGAHTPVHHACENIWDISCCIREYSYMSVDLYGSHLVPPLLYLPQFGHFLLLIMY